VQHCTLTHLHFTDKNLPPGDQIDIEAEMARLEAQQEARRKVSWRSIVLSTSIEFKLQCV